MISAISQRFSSGEVEVGAISVISMAFLTPPMTHPMTGTSLGPEARLLVYFH